MNQFPWMSDQRPGNPLVSSLNDPRASTMNLTTPALKSMIRPSETSGDSITALLQKAGANAGPLASDDSLGMVMSGLSGVATALAVAILLSVYFRTGYRSGRDVAKHGGAAALVLALGLIAFVAYDMRQAALAYLGINPATPAIEFEIRLPKAALSAISDTQIELRTDRNQTLAKLADALDLTDGRSVLRGSVALKYRTTDRVVVLNLPGQPQREFKLRLSASPSHSDQFSPWHLADRVNVSSSVSNGTTTSEPNDIFAIRYRVL
jgi:hypothetical protein